MARTELESVQLGLRHDLTAQSREIQQLREQERELHVRRERGEGVQPRGYLQALLGSG